MRVLISGAGVAGPALAWFLARIGARVTVVEKAHALLPYGQNIDVNGSALIIMKRMGLFDELRRYNTTEKGTQFIDPKGRAFAPLPVQGDSTLSATAQYEILRGDLSLIFYEASRKSPNVNYRFNTTVQEVISNDEQAVKVRTSDGGVEEYDLLVAADGQWSKIRKWCFPPETVQIRDMRMYAIYFTVPRLPEDNDWWNVYSALGSKIITIRPDPHGTIRAMFTIVPRTKSQKQEWASAARSDRLTKNELIRKEFENAGWQARRLLDAMDQAEDFYFHKIEQIRASQWSKGRIVLMGDAAWTPSPLTGAGANLAILGPYVLAGELSKLGKDENPMKALEAFDKAFRPFVEKIQDVPSIFPSIGHPNSRLWRKMLSLSMLAVSKIATSSWLPKPSKRVDDEDFLIPEYEALWKEQPLRAK